MPAIVPLDKILGLVLCEMRTVLIQPPYIPAVIVNHNHPRDRRLGFVPLYCCWHFWALTKRSCIVVHPRSTEYQHDSKDSDCQKPCHHLITTAHALWLIFWQPGRCWWQVIILLWLFGLRVCSWCPVCFLICHNAITLFTNELAQLESNQSPSGFNRMLNHLSYTPLVGQFKVMSGTIGCIMRIELISSWPTTKRIIRYAIRTMLVRLL
jgi:hypothetical protein